MLNPLPANVNGTDTILVCIHWKTFPPVEVWNLGTTPDPRALCQALPDARYNLFLIWQKICGLTAMTEEKCRACSCARWLLDRGSEIPMLVSMDGTIKVSAVDIPQHDALPRARHNLGLMHRRAGQVGSGEPADWVKQKNKTDEGGGNA